tara:strand:- start:5064 stop:5549 length:486 start_codon:yes stop_codon:yes gene_type:complete
MKELVLIRHAKSSWELNVEDCNRPLTKKGIERIKKIVLSSPDVFSSTDVIYSSNANRATHTTLIMVNALSIPLDKVNITKELYTFEISKLAYFIKNIPNTFKRVICIGHNPAFTEAISYFSKDFLSHLPTSGWAKLEFKQSKWAEIADGNLTLGIPKQILK